MYILMYHNLINGNIHESFRYRSRPLTLEEVNQEEIILNMRIREQGISGHYYATPILDI